ncbi:MAG TPA: hypothetical protein VN700_01865 [Vicinamibacterales bacterium]|nr:hypothetical protein [Vicinamibacterales bacterium]
MVSLTLTCVGGLAPPATAWERPPVLVTGDRIGAILTDGSMLVLSADDGTVLFKSAAAASLPATAGQLTVSTATRSLYSLVLTASGAAIKALNLEDLSERTVQTLTDASYVAIAVGKRSRNLYVFGSHGLHVKVLSPADGSLVRLLTGSGRQSDLSVFDGAVSDDEQRVYLSYHGFGTGIDWFDISSKAPVACTGQRNAMTGCLLAHGRFVVEGARVLAATGEAHLVELDLATLKQRSLDTGLHGNHLMEFAFDRPRGVAYALGACDYAGGLSAAGSRAGAPRVLVPPGDYRICGDTIDVSADGRWMVVGARATTIGGPGLSANLSARLLVIDVASGVVRRTIALPSAPLDVVTLQ